MTFWIFMCIWFILTVPDHRRFVGGCSFTHTSAIDQVVRIHLTLDLGQYNLIDREDSYLPYNLNCCRELFQMVILIFGVCTSGTCLSVDFKCTDLVQCTCPWPMLIQTWSHLSPRSLCPDYCTPEGFLKPARVCTSACGIENGQKGRKVSRVARSDAFNAL